MKTEKIKTFFMSTKWKRISSIATIILFLVMIYIWARTSISDIQWVGLAPDVFASYPGLNEMIPKVFYGIIGWLITKLKSSIENLQDNENWKASQRKLERGGLLRKDTLIRISFAYLFRIKVDGSYLLVPNNRTGKLQPVGGAYKFNDKERRYLDDTFSAEDDDCIPINQTTRHDYRLNIKNKYLRDFVKRFNNTNNRENVSDLSREFSEELIKTNILDKTVFNEIRYRYVGRHMTEIIRTSFKPYELLLADIVELELTAEQEEFLRSLKATQSNDYLFANGHQIRNYGIEIGTENLEDSIANHSWKILTESSDELIKKENTNVFTVLINGTH